MARGLRSIRRQRPVRAGSASVRVFVAILLTAELATSEAELHEPRPGVLPRPARTLRTSPWWMRDFRAGRKSIYLGRYRKPAAVRAAGVRGRRRIARPNRPAHARRYRTSPPIHRP